MPTGTINNVLAFAEAQLGQPYLYGGEGNGGFDCSGLTQAAYRSAGVALPRTAQQQYSAVNKVATPAVGDLVFFGSSPTTVEHVGIYLGNGKMLDAPHTGAKIRIENVWSGVVGYGRPLAGANNVDPSLSSVAAAGGASTVADTTSVQTVSLKGTVTSGLTRLTVEGVIVLGGVALVVLGAWKGTTAGRATSREVSKQKQQFSDIAGQAQGPGGGKAGGSAGSAEGAGGAAAELPELAGMAALA